MPAINNATVEALQAPAACSACTCVQHPFRECCVLCGVLLQVERLTGDMGPEDKQKLYGSKTFQMLAGGCHRPVQGDSSPDNGLVACCTVICQPVTQGP